MWHCDHAEAIKHAGAIDKAVSIPCGTRVATLVEAVSRVPEIEVGRWTSIFRRHCIHAISRRETRRAHVGSHEANY